MTSGNFITSDSGRGGGNYFGRLVFEWWRTDWGRSGGVGYHNISFTLKTYGGNPSYWQYVYNRSMNVDGAGFSGGQQQCYGAGATTLFSGSKTLWTDGAGNRSFGASAQAGIYTSAVNTSGSGSWAMDNIPMYATISGYSGSINDEAGSVYLSYSNPTGSACTFDLFVRPLGSSGGFTQVLNYPNYPSGANVASSVNWANVRSALANTNQGQLLYRITNNVGITDLGWENQAILSIVNANPVFTTATYKDSNSATVAITGNDQYLIQNYSTLEATILSANKATALKSATMTKYNMAIGSINQDVTYSTSTIAQNLGTLGINSNANLTIRAVDSRNNGTNVVLPVNVLAYIPPQITATANRINNFETSTDFHIEATISRLTVAGTDKNAVNSTSGVRYRYKKTTDATWGSWINKASTTSAGVVAVTDFNVPTALDRNFAWDIQVEVTDKLNTTTINLLLSVGIPVFRIGLDGKVYNNEIEIATIMQRLPYYNGDIEAHGGAVNKGLGVSRELNYGLTKTNSTTLTVTVKGVYELQIQQLISTVNAGYLQIQVNGSAVVYGYYEGNSMDDVGASIIKELNVGDTIRVYQTHAISNSWQAQHSNISVKCLARL